MARQFSKNLSNYMSLGTASIGPLLNGKAAVSVHCWVYPNSYTGGAANDNLVLSVIRDGATVGVSLGIDDSTGTKAVRVTGRSTGETRQVKSGTTSVPLGQWSSIGGVLNFSGDSITPYFNGSAENGGAVTFTNSSYTQGTPTSADTIGCYQAPPTLLETLWDGYIAEVAIFGVDIGSSGFTSLAAGKSPYMVDAANLLFYAPLYGKFASVEPSTISSISGTITGSIPNVSHPQATTGTYDLREDHTVNITASWPPPAPIVPAQGSSVLDNNFSTRVYRVSDGNSGSGGNRSMRTPSSSAAVAWSKDGTHFWTIDTQGGCHIWTFNAATATFAHLRATTMLPEPIFSARDNDVMIAKRSGTPTLIEAYSVSGNSYSSIFNITTIDPAATSVRAGIYASFDPRERIICMWGGNSQDTDFKVAVFDKANTANRKWVDTQNSLLNGVTPTNITLGFLAHGLAISKDGQFASIYPRGEDVAAGKAPCYIWNLATDEFIGLTVTSPYYEAGHTVEGWGVRVNSAPFTGPYDGLQWSMRSYTTPANAVELLTPVLTPKVVYVGDHVNWNNAVTSAQVPFISANHYHTQWPPEVDNPWRPLMDEIMLISPTGPTHVYRICSHFSDVRPDDGSGAYGFWATPRPQISFDGQWAIFTSNWAKTLGDDPFEGDTNTTKRQDVFLVKLDRETGSPLLGSSGLGTNYYGQFYYGQDAAVGPVFTTKAIDATVTTTASISFVELINKIVSASVTTTASLSRQIQRTLATSIVSTAAVISSFVVEAFNIRRATTKLLAKARTTFATNKPKITKDANPVRTSKDITSE